MKIIAQGLIALLLIGSAAEAQIAVSANDGKQLRPGEAPSTRTPDSVSLIDLRRYPPRLLGSVAAPASMIGAPAAVAIAPGGRFAIVTCNQRLNEGGELVPAGFVSVIDISRPEAPSLVQTLEVSPGAGGVTINPAGTLALVASNSDDTVAVFSIAGARLTPVGKVQIEAKGRPTDVIFARDGRSAFVVAQGAGKLVRLAVSGTNVTVAGDAAKLGIQPYGGAISRDGRYLYNANLGGGPGATPPPQGQPRIGAVTGVNLATGQVESIDVGQVPEHVTLSRDSRYLAAVVANGSAAQPGSPGYNPNGLLQIYRTEGTKLTRVAETPTGAWCQGAVFSDDGGTILLQCAMTRQIEVYRFDGSALTQDKAATIRLTSRPGSIATPSSR